MDKINLTPFKWEDIDGKDLTIHVGVDIANGKDCTVVTGYDKETGKYYVLNEKFLDVPSKLGQNGEVK